MAESTSRTAAGRSKNKGEKSPQPVAANRRRATTKLARVPTLSGSRQGALPIERTMPIELHWLALTTSGGDFAFGAAEQK